MEAISWSEKWLDEISSQAQNGDQKSRQKAHENKRKEIEMTTARTRKYGNKAFQFASSVKPGRRSLNESCGCQALLDAEEEMEAQDSILDVADDETVVESFSRYMTEKSDYFDSRDDQVSDVYDTPFIDAEDADTANPGSDFEDHGSVFDPQYDPMNAADVADENEDMDPGYDEDELMQPDMHGSIMPESYDPNVGEEQVGCAANEEYDEIIMDDFSEEIEPPEEDDEDDDDDDDEEDAVKDDLPDDVEDEVMGALDDAEEDVDTAKEAVDAAADALEDAEEEIQDAEEEVGTAGDED